MLHFEKAQGLVKVAFPYKGQQRNYIGVCIKMLGAGSQVPEPLWPLLLSLSLGAC